MNLIDDISDLLSSKKNRRILLLLAILFSELTAICLYYDMRGFSFFAGDDRLSRFLDITQSLLITATLVYFFIHSNKEESLRYENNPYFYIKRYPQEFHRYLAIDRSNEPYLFVTLGTNRGDVSDFLKKKPLCDKMLKSKLENYLLSNSIQEFSPKMKTFIGDLNFIKPDSNYDLPWVIANHANNLLIRKFNVSEKLDYNGTTLALRGYKQQPDGKINFEFAKSYYYNYLVTNMMPEVRVIQKSTVRDILEPNKKLNRLDSSLAENHLGLSVLVLTTDNYLIIPKRTSNTTVFKGQLSPSVSGAASIITCTGEDGEISPKNWFVREFREELGNIFPDVDTKNYFDVDSIEFIGMSRELKRLGKPEIFFLCRLANLTSDDLIKSNSALHYLSFEATSTRGESKASGTSDNIDENENEAYFIADIDELIKRFDISHKVKKYWNKKDKIDYDITVSVPEVLHNKFKFKRHHKKMIVSESLFVNCIFYLKWKESQMDQLAKLSHH